MPTNPKLDTTKILIDADVIRHFLIGDKLNELSSIFPDRLVLVDKVKEELFRSERLRLPIFNFIRDSRIEEVTLEDNEEAVEEFAKLIETVGEGEAACMALAKTEKKYIASSNLSDIIDYCEKNGIKYYTTMDILYEAIMNQLFDEPACDEFIRKVLSADSKLPYTNITEYVLKHKMQ